MCKSVILVSPRKPASFFTSPGSNLDLLPELLQLPLSSAWASLFARMHLQEWLCALDSALTGSMLSKPSLEACFPLLIV